MNARLARLKLCPRSGTSSLPSFPKAPLLKWSTSTHPRRHFTQATSSPQSRPPSGLSPFLTVLFFAGIGATAYGVYDIYDTLTLWPPEVRKDLRSGLRAKHSGDLNASEQYLQRAWTTAKSLPLSLFASEPHLKVSGIAVCLASVLEQSQKLERAFEVYEEALDRLPRTWEGLSGKEKLRAVGIAYKLGEMAGNIKGKEEKEEGYLAWAVEALLKSVKDESERKTGESQELVGKSVDEADDPIITGLQLPKWATQSDIAAPFEALGSFYAKSGKSEYAIPLYLQAISVLIPASPRSSSANDRCRGAQLMTALSDIIMRSADPQSLSETLHQAELWSKKAFDIAIQYSSVLNMNNAVQNPNCDVALAVAVYNIGILKKAR